MTSGADDTQLIVPHADAASVPWPDGVERVLLSPIADDRGDLTEIWASSADGVDVAQWTVLRSRAGVLRGVHAHRRHRDVIAVAAGEVVIGLQDLRRGTPTYGIAATVRLDALSSALVVPPGVAHGVWSPSESVLLVGTDHVFDPADDQGCHWRSEGLTIGWGPIEPRLSERDQTAGPLEELEAFVTG